jgi:hypothetical protein
MGNFAASLQIASVASALGWPLALGVAVVVWSRARAAAHARRIAAMEGELKDMYRAVETKPVPPRLAMVVDALAEGEELAAARTKGKGRTATPAGS